MDIESEEISTTQVITICHKVAKIAKKVHAAKVYSQNRKTARKHLLVQQQKAYIRKLSQHEQQQSNVQNVAPNFNKNPFKEFLMQVPETKSVPVSNVNECSPSNSTYYLSEVLKSYKDAQSPVREHLTTSLQILKALQNSKMPSKQQIKAKKLNLQRKSGYKNKKTVVFDLDQTLIHCNESINVEHDLKITIKFPTGEVAEAGINIRPGAVELLKSLKGNYEVIIFTASHSCYANEILNFLDPEGDLIHHRLFREHCQISNEGFFVKDLRILNREMKDVLLVDNAAYSYAFQLDNGVPILPYFKGKHDYELKTLQNYLMDLVAQDDLREANRKLFKLNRYSEFDDSVEKLVEKLYLEP